LLFLDKNMPNLELEGGAILIAVVDTPIAMVFIQFLTRKTSRIVSDFRSQGRIQGAWARGAEAPL
jgi:hypothetical protein